MMWQGGSGAILSLLSLGDAHYAAAHLALDQGETANASSVQHSKAEWAYEKALSRMGSGTSRWGVEQDSSRINCRIHALTGLAKVALSRGLPLKCVELLADCPAEDPAVLQLRGEAHAEMGALEAARDVLQQAVALWQKVGDGMHVQARPALVSCRVVSCRIVSYHAISYRILSDRIVSCLIVSYCIISHLRQVGSRSTACGNASASRIKLTPVE